VGENDGALLLFQLDYPFGEGLIGTGGQDGITTSLVNDVSLMNKCYPFVPLTIVKCGTAPPRAPTETVLWREPYLNETRQS